MKILATGSNPTNITTTPPALAVNTCPTNAKSFELQGRSLVLNQLVNKANAQASSTSQTVTCTNNGDGSFTINGTATGGDAYLYMYTSSISLLSSHKYIAVGGFFKMTFSTGGTTSYSDSSVVFTGKESLTQIWYRVDNGVSVNVTIWPMLIDLTQTFGAGFEPTTVDHLKSVIDLSKYIPFNPGTFIHNNSVYEANKWNQLIPISTESSSGVFTNNNDGTWTINGATESTVLKTVADYLETVLILNHKYISTCYSGNANVWTYDAWSNRIPATGNANIFTYSSTATRIQFSIRVGAGTYSNVKVTPQLIDLTDIFGAGKEPSTVDECKLRFLSMGIDITKYQPYSPLGGQYCGYRNIWDEEWEVGSITSDGSYASNTDTIRSKNFTPVFPNTSYYINKSFRAVYYDVNKNFLYREANPVNQFATPSNCYYIKITGTTTYGPTYKNDISIYQVSNKVDLGFNIWDEEWELGTINSSTGQNVNASDQIRSKNYMLVTPNTNYYIRSGGVNIFIREYAADKSYIRGYQEHDTVNTVSSSCVYLRFCTYQTTYNNDICINLSQPDTTKSPHNGDYRPYLMLRGIGSDFNVWDEAWEVGYYDDDGNKSWRTDVIRSKNFIPVLPETAYYFKRGGPISTVYAFYYDSAQNFLSKSPGAGVGNSVFTTSTNTRYMTFFVASQYGTTYNHDICINLSQPQTTINPHNGQYVPHLFDTYDSMSGILTRRIGAVNLGTLTWSLRNTNTFYASVSMKGPGSDNLIAQILCEKYTPATYNSVFSASLDKVIGLSAEGVYVCVNDTAYTNATTFKAAMNGVMLLYELNAYQVFTPTSKIGVVDMGSLTWTRVDVTGSGGYVFSTPATPLQMYKQSDNLWCSGYTTGHYNGTGSAIYNYGDKTIAQHSPSGEFNIYVRDDSYTSASAFTNAVKGKILTYELSDSVSQTTITQPISFVAGKLGKRYGVVDLGSLSWTYQSTYNYFYLSFSSAKTPTVNLICAKYKTVDGTVLTNITTNDKVVAIRSGNLVIKDSLYTDATTFKNSLHGQYLIYELVDEATGMTYATAGNLIQKTNGDVGDVDFNLKYWENSQVKLLKAGNKYLAVNE